MRILTIGCCALGVSLTGCAGTDDPETGSVEERTLLATLPDGRNATVYYEVVDGRAIAEGDMVLDLELSSGPAPEVRSNVLTPGANGFGFPWENGVIPFEIQNTDPDHREWVQQAIDHWLAFTPIQLVRFDAAVHSSRVVFVDAVTLCNSNVGSVGGTQIINVGSNCGGPAGVIHEVGHAAGLLHEHSRADRDQNITLSGNWQDDLVNWGTQGVSVGAYDGTSIMHYAPGDYNYIANGHQIIVTLGDGAVTVDPGDRLSAGDIEGLQAIYPLRRVVDPQYYLAYWQDLANAFGGNHAAAYAHWAQWGEDEGRNSSPAFSVRDYIDLNPDRSSVFGTNFNTAALHYQEWGMREGRRSSLAFDPAHYLHRHPDVRDAYGTTAYADAGEHFAVHGIHEGRESSPVFDVGYYLSQHADLVNAFGPTNYLAALIHWQTYGLAEGRTAHAYFSPALYLSRYPDLQAAFGSTNYRAATVHYLTWGMYEGRSGRP